MENKKEETEKTDKIVNMGMPLFLFIASLYFILTSNWLWPTKLLVFILVIISLKKTFFPKQGVELKIGKNKN